ncbi:MAG: porin family protein [Bacteroidota bacterium]
MKTTPFLLVIAALLCCGPLHAQFEFGIKAGLTTASLEGENLAFSGQGLEDLGLALQDADYGLQAGVFFRIPVGKFFLQPEVTFNTQEANFRLNGEGEGITTAFSERYNDLDVPLLIGYKLGPLRLMGGPVGHFRLTEESSILSQEGWDATLETFNLGIALGGALDIGPVTLDVRYDNNLSKFGQTFSFGGESVAIDQAAKRWVFTLGYRF